MADNLNEYSLLGESLDPDSTISDEQRRSEENQILDKSAGKPNKTKGDESSGDGHQSPDSNKKRKKTLKYGLNEKTRRPYCGRQKRIRLNDSGESLQGLTQILNTGTSKSSGSPNSASKPEEMTATPSKENATHTLTAGPEMVSLSIGMHPATPMGVPLPPHNDGMAMMSSMMIPPGMDRDRDCETKQCDRGCDQGEERNKERDSNRDGERVGERDWDVERERKEGGGKPGEVEPNPGPSEFSMREREKRLQRHRERDSELERSTSRERSRSREKSGGRSRSHERERKTSDQKNQSE